MPEVKKIEMPFPIRIGVFFYKIKTSIKAHTLDIRLNNLAQQGLVEKLYKKDIGKKISPGGDKFEYKLTPKGQTTKEEIIKLGLTIFEPSITQLNSRRVAKLESSDKSITKDKEE